jgi:aminoglycoside phosphotransferase (APT) family kinase protein
MDQQQVMARLETYISDQLAVAVTISGAVPIAGGASRDTWLIDLHIDGAAERWVLRRDLPTSMYATALTRAQEYALIAAAHAHGVNAPRPRLLCEDAGVLGLPFLLMQYVEGISIGRKVIQMPELADARQRLPAQMAAQLAAIHAIATDTAAVHALPHPPTDISPTQAALDEATAMLDTLKIDNPVFAFALRWCAQHQPAPVPLSLVHGDFRLGNLLVTPAGLSAVLDWEFAHVGDPREDMGYPCMRDWRFGNGRLRFSGLCDREDFLRAYEQHSHSTVERAAVDWWEIVGNLRWAVICLMQAERHLSGKDVSVEYASLGRRSAEMQHELLSLIQTAER